MRRPPINQQTYSSHAGVSPNVWIFPYRERISLQLFLKSLWFSSLLYKRWYYVAENHLRFQLEILVWILILMWIFGSICIAASFFLSHSQCFIGKYLSGKNAKLVHAFVTFLYCADFQEILLQNSKLHVL